tara:strand:- start:181 stop:459 length:279 start_codon:yes stop_codon:yes gene_type:complete
LTSIKFFGVFEAMKKDSSKDRKFKYLSINSVKLPEFINHEGIEQINEVTNVIRVPFGRRLAKKKRPEKNQHIATLILPITSLNSPTPPPNVA